MAQGWEYGWVITTAGFNYGPYDSLSWQRLGGDVEVIVEYKRFADPAQRAEHGGRIRREHVALITRLGREGWELVAIQGTHLWFKRPIEDPARLL
jgi:hypothetical protein